MRSDRWQRRLGVLEHRSRVRSRRFDRRRYAYLDCYSYEELEELAGLAEKAEAAAAQGKDVEWTAAEVAALMRLEAVRQRCPARN